MGLLDKVVSPVRNLFARPTRDSRGGYATMTEYAPAFSSWDGRLYEQLQIRAIIERIATAGSKLRPEFVTPDGSGGSVPRVQRLFTAWPNDMMTWPDFLRLLFTRLFTDNVAYVVPGYDRDQNIIALYPMKPSYAEVVDYEGEPWIRFHLVTGETQVFPFYDVAILTRFQFRSDIFGSSNDPLNPTLRLMDAQRQAEEVALRTGADIKFIGQLKTLTHEDDLKAKRDRFAADNFGPSNKSGLLLYDPSFDNLQQIKTDHYTIDPEEMERIDRALYAYFGINERILNNSYDEAGWAAFYEGVIEPVALMIGQRLTWLLLTPTQVRKGNHVMFSSSYLEYATTDAKIKVAQLYATTGTGTKNDIRDIFQLPRLPEGDVFMVRGEIYITDEHNNIIAESGGHGDGSGGRRLFDDLDEPDDMDVPGGIAAGGSE